MSERCPATHGGLDGVLELRRRWDAALDGLRERRVSSVGQGGVDGQEYENDSGNIKRELAELAFKNRRPLAINSYR